MNYPPATASGRDSEYDRITQYPPTYYPGVADRKLAPVFHLERGQELNLSPWALPLASEEISILGTVEWPGGAPAVTAAVDLIVKSTGALAMRTARVKSDGSFVLFGLKGLDYRLRATAEEGRPATLFEAEGDLRNPHLILKRSVVGQQ